MQSSAVRSLRWAQVADSTELTLHTLGVRLAMFFGEHRLPEALQAIAMDAFILPQCIVRVEQQRLWMLDARQNRRGVHLLILAEAPT